jgi:hypothetical protein|nr:MAG TPA: hypothetical protein [Caudoviricetes sp.]
MSTFAHKNKKRMKQQRKVIHVELNEPYKDKHHWYFGSITAIYDILPVDVVGIAHTSLWNVLAKNGEYKTKTATIRLGVLHSKQTNRGKKATDNES